MNIFVSYFDLQAEVAELGGGGTQNVRQLSLYLGTLLGALSRVIYDAFEIGQITEASQFGIAAIGSIVTFPLIYRRANLNLGRLSPVKYFVAFQHGFFWSLLIAIVARQF
jgi:hypothetical protein